MRALEDVLFEGGKIEVVQELFAVDFGVKFPPYRDEIFDRFEGAFGHLDSLVIDDERDDHSALNLLVCEGYCAREISVTAHLIAELLRSFFVDSGRNFIHNRSKLLKLFAFANKLFNFALQIYVQKLKLILKSSKI